MDIKATRQTHFCWYKAQMWQISGWHFSPVADICWIHTALISERAYRISGLAVTLAPVKDIEWTKDSLRQVGCRRVQTSGAERRKGPTTEKQTEWDWQVTDVFLCKGHKHDSVNFEDGWRAQKIVQKSVRTGGRGTNQTNKALCDRGSERTLQKWKN